MVFDGLSPFKGRCSIGCRGAGMSVSPGEVIKVQ